MSRLKLVTGLAGVVLLAVSHSPAQAHMAYTVTETISMFGPTMNMTVYRNGSKAVIDQSSAPTAGNPKGLHVRSFFDLDAHKNFTWDLIDTSGGCGTGTFSGDWGDPFVPMDGLASAKQTGTDTMNGFSTKVYEAEAEGAKIKAWVDTKSGLTIKVQVTQGGETKTMTEVKQATMSAPPASVFALPASCTAAAAPQISLRDQKIADETGSKVGDFVDAVMTDTVNPQATCAVTVRVMKAGSMTPITSGFKLSANAIDDAKLAQGDTSPGAAVPVTMGANGVARIANPPLHFNLNEDFGDAGGGGGMIHRQCWGPVSTLLLVVQDPQHLGLGVDLVWDKNGKYAVK